MRDEDAAGPDGARQHSDDGPTEAASALTPLRPLGLAGSVATGATMGVVELVPGFSAGTVVLIAGMYDRLIGSIRQGAHVLSMLLRGRLGDALRAITVIEWPFVLTLFGAMAVAVLTAADAISRLLADHPVEMSAVFLGLVVGAAIVATRQLAAPSVRHGLTAMGAGVVTWTLLGFRPGVIEDPSLVVLGLGAAVAVCAWILPGISGAFLLLLIGLYQPFVGAVSERDLAALAVIAVGLVVGVSAFSTLLHWLLARHRDAVIAVAIGLMLGSVRLLWPWPSHGGVGGSPALATPVADEAPRALALGLIAFALVCLFGLVAGAIQHRRGDTTTATSGAEGP